MLADDQWSLIYGDTVYTFGTGATPVFNGTAPDLGDVDVRDSDADLPRTDGVSFGRDYRGARTITFDLGVRGASEDSVRSSMQALAAAWRADEVRSKAGAVAELRARYRGVERSVFGRPRRFAPNLSEAKMGHGTAVADFKCQDDRFYTSEASSVSVSLVPPPGGGLIAPLAAPLTTTPSSDRSVAMTVLSDLDVWPVIEVVGPITSPVVELVGLWRLEFAVTVPAGQSLVIDTQPWSRTALLNGVSVAGKLTRSSVRIGSASVPPGIHELALRGVSTTGTAVAHISWRDAFPSL